MTTTTAKKSTPRKTKRAAKPTQKKNTVTVPSISLPAIRGIECKHEFYIAQVRYGLMERLFTFTNPNESAPFRQQRKINPSKVNKLINYLGQDFHSMGAAIASVNPPNSDDFNFEPVSKDADVGILYIPLESTVLISDGQHRISAICKAVRENPDLRDNTLPVLFHWFLGLGIEQQRFTDHNSNVTKPTSSLNQFYDGRQEQNRIAKILWRRFPLFTEYTELEATSIGAKSQKVFTFNAIVAMVKILDKAVGPMSESERVKLYLEFLIGLQDNVPLWGKLRRKIADPVEVRSEYLCCHAVALEALAYIGAELYELKDQLTFADMLEHTALKKMNWAASNPAFDDLIRFDGKISKTVTHCKALAEHILRGQDR